MQDIVVIDGELSLLVEGRADCDLLLPESGECGLFMVMREAYPAYTGPVEITPGSEAVVLGTTMKSVLTDIVINPVPSNYGLIEWNGSTLTVS